MKFGNQLTEAILLKRVIRFMGEVVLPNRQKIMVRCPNIGDLRGCDILGTKIWYSSAVGYHCLPTWELVEVDEGYLVCINPELMKPLVIEAIKGEVIEGLVGYNILHAGGQYDQFRSQFLLLEKKEQQCYVGIEQVLLCDESGVGLFPTRLGEGIDNLHALIQARNEGHRAVLIYCVMHAGVNAIKPQFAEDSAYYLLLQQAMHAGVEIVAYKTTISLESIELNTQLPVMTSNQSKLRSQ